MPNFQGFSGPEMERMKKVIAVAKHCIHKAQDEAFADYKQFIRRTHKYFDLKSAAGGAEAANHQIMKAVSSMRLMIETDMYNVIKGGDGGNTNADMRTVIGVHRTKFSGDKKDIAVQARNQGTMMLYEGKRINAYEARLMIFQQQGTGAPMNFYSGFFKLPAALNDQQSQVEVFLHELSHGAAATEDVDSPSCYGFQGVQYCKRNGTSTVNAENYGFYLQSYIFE